MATKLDILNGWGPRPKLRPQTEDQKELEAKARERSLRSRISPTGEVNASSETFISSDHSGPWQRAEA